MNAFLLVYQIGSCCVYIVFIAENIKSVVDEYGIILDTRIYMLALLLPLILINFVKNLKFLAPFSSAANIVTIASLGFILYYIIADKPQIEDKKPIGEIRNYPLFFGTVLFALEAIGVVSPKKSYLLLLITYFA